MTHAPHATHVGVIWLDTADDTPALGGKARALARMAAAGLPVPPGFVLPADALPGAPPAAYDAARPDAAADALVCGYQELARRVGMPEPLVAVRSSGMAEDLAQASFAGQYVTVLGVCGEAALLEAARRVWSSLRAPGVAAYRAAVEARAGEPLPPPGMAVLVQALVPADAAGVAETADLLTGGGEEVAVSAAWGLGRAVVDGLVQPDRYRVARAGGALLELRTGDKRVRVAPGGASEPLPEDLWRRPCLSAEQASAVAALALRAEEIIGGPADVEWALAGGALWLLQARPLTSAPPAEAAAPAGPLGPRPDFPFAWPDAAAPTRHWRQDAEDGRDFEAYRPFELDARHAFTRGQAWGGWLTGAPRTPQNLEVNGYLYSADVPVPDEAERAMRQEAYLRGVRALHARGETMFGTVMVPEIQADTRRLAAVPVDDLPAEELAGHFEEVLRWYEHAWALHFSMDPWDEHSPVGRCAALYRQITGDERPWAVFAPFSHAPQAEHEALAQLIALARTVKAAPALLALFSAHEPAVVLRELDTAAGGEVFRRGLDALLADFGLHCGASQGVSIGQVLPSWGEDPSLVVALVQRYLAADLDALEAAYRRSTAQYASDVAQVRDRVAGSGGSPAQVAEFDAWFAATGRMICQILDHNHHIDSPANALLHRGLMACGRRLVGAGALDDAADVWWLRAHQIAAALRSLGLAERPDWRRLVAARKALHEWQRSLTPPAYLGAPPPTPQPAPAAAQDEAPPSLLVRGEPAVPGVASGRVRLVTSGLVPEVQPGDVFVARDCGVLWASVLPVAAAVVLDGSNQHEHAMRVCRDFGVPGVVQARGATCTLREGQRVTVDGGRGWVLAAE